MSRRPLKPLWRKRLWSTNAVSPAVVRTLLLMSEYMRDDGYVSVERSILATTLGCHERKVSAHIAAAIEADLLTRLSRGYIGHKAEFRAVLPGPKRVPITSTLSTTQEGANNYHPLGTPKSAPSYVNLHAQEGAGNGHPYLGADLSSVAQHQTRAAMDGWV